MEQAGNESISLFKMAIVSLLTVLVVSAGVIIFNRVYTWLNNDTSSLKQTMLQAQMDKFFDLEDMSDTARIKSGNYPLVTIVANTILECQSQDILFYQIFDSSGTSIAAYSQADLTGIIVGGATPVSNPEDAAASYLMMYAGRRCSVTVFGDGDSDDDIITHSGVSKQYPAGLYAIIIQIMPE